MKNLFVHTNSSAESLSLIPNFSWVQSLHWETPNVATVSARDSASSRGRLRISKSLFSAIALFALASSAHATPYACDITNNAGIVSFRLNENADNVKIVRGAVSNDIGPGVKGLTVTNLGIASGFIKVMVTRSAPAGYTQPSDDAFQNNGVYVNKFEQAPGLP